MSKPLIVIAQCTALPKDAARLLRKLADQIEAGDYTSITNCGMRAFVREGEEHEPGEQPIAGRYIAVDFEDSPAGHPIALFRRQGDADAWIGKRQGLVKVRAEIAGSEWNSVDPDPHG